MPSHASVWLPSAVEISVLEGGDIVGTAIRYHAVAGHKVHGEIQLLPGCRKVLVALLGTATTQGCPLSTSGHSSEGQGSCRRDGCQGRVVLFVFVGGRNWPRRSGGIAVLRRGRGVRNWEGGGRDAQRIYRGVRRTTRRIGTRLDGGRGINSVCARRGRRKDRVE